MKEGKYVILCIDDDPDVLTMLQTILETNGYAFVSAASAEEGLNVYREEQPDLIIVDLMMESIDAGRNFVKELKILGNRAPVYMLSSVGDAMAQNINTAELGLMGIFQKPLAPDTLLMTLKAKLK